MVGERASKQCENAESAVAQTQMQQKYIADKLKRLEENEGRIENKRQRKQYSDNIRDGEAQIADGGKLRAADGKSE